MVYRYLFSPVLVPSCRFTPSCSQYALEALEKQGFARGIWLSIRRILRCHPWGLGGDDPVPESQIYRLQLDSREYSVSPSH